MYVVVFIRWRGAAGPFDSYGEAVEWVESLPKYRVIDSEIHRLDTPKALADQWAMFALDDED